MPSIKDHTTVDAIAKEYCSNGRNKLEALKTIGYRKSYYSTRGIGVVYSNDKITAAIAKIDGKGAIKQERTISSLDKMYQAAYDIAEKTKQPTAMTGAVTGIARLYGMDKDSVTDKQADKLKESETAEANRIANIRLAESRTG